MGLDTVRFATNVPEVVALQFDVGRTVEGAYGDQVMFTLTDGRRMYVNPFVAEKIYAAGVSKGEFFSICKREVIHGNRRTVEYQVETKNETTARAHDNVTPAAVSRVAAPTHEQTTTPVNAPAPAPHVSAPTWDEYAKRENAPHCNARPRPSRARRSPT